MRPSPNPSDDTTRMASGRIAVLAGAIIGLLLVATGCHSTAAATHQRRSAPTSAAPVEHAPAPTSTTQEPRRATPASTVTLDPQGFVEVFGRFLGRPQVITNSQPDGELFTFDVRGSDAWSGTTAGTSTYTGHGRFDPATGETWESLDETFTGSVDGLGSGTIRFVDYLHVSAAGAMHTWCVATGGSGDLRGMRGGLEFTTTKTVDPDETGNGAGYGTIVGFLDRPPSR